MINLPFIEGAEFRALRPPLVLAEKIGSLGLPLVDYPNLISCRAEWMGGGRLISGTLFATDEACIVQMDGIHIDALPQGVVLVRVNDDVPGVIGRVGTLPGANKINIAERRLGREALGDARCRLLIWMMTCRRMFWSI